MAALAFDTLNRLSPPLGLAPTSMYGLVLVALTILEMYR